MLAFLLSPLNMALELIAEPMRAGQWFALAAGGAGQDSLREQKKPEARKMPENGAESHQSSAGFVRRLFVLNIVDIFGIWCFIFWKLF